MCDIGKQPEAPIVDDFTPGKRSSNCLSCPTNSQKHKDIPFSIKLRKVAVIAFKKVEHVYFCYFYLKK